MTDLAEMAEIEDCAKIYAAERKALADYIAALNGDIQALKDLRLPEIRTQAVRTAAAFDALHTEIDRNRELFQRPKTRLLHGIKLGLRKAAGALTWADEAAVVTRIRRLFPSKTDTLLKETAKPVKSALARLPAADLKKLGVNVGDSSDQVLIQVADGDIEKLVQALLEDGAPEAGDAACRRAST